MITAQEIQEKVKFFDGWAREWKEEARECYAFVAGDQWSEEDVSIMRDQRRPIVTFNRIAPMVAAAAGVELMNRQECTFMPREAGDTAVAEAYNAANRFCRDQGDFDDEESEAFFDTIVSGMGWTETVVNFDDDPDGKIEKHRRDPLEMGWDWRATKHNLFDGEFRFRRCRYTARQMEERWPGSTEQVSPAGRPDSGDVSSAADTPGDRYEATERGRPHDRDARYEVIQYQYVRRAPVYVVMDPGTGQTAEFEPGEFEVLRQRASGLGIELHHAVRRPQRYAQLYVCGAHVLEPESPLDDGWTLQCITGTRDRNRNYWYGLVRVMIDPQRWANKFLSTIQHTMSTSGRGIMAEKDAFDNPRKAEEDWAKPDSIAWMRQGAISGRKVDQKPSGIMPPGIDHLLTFAVSSIRDTSGLNLEMMGLANRQQAGVLEQERKQAGITILAPLMNGLRRYRKADGRLMLMTIHRFFPPQRNVRIMGPDGARSVQYARSGDRPGLDIVVDDMPTAPNQKQQVWQIVMQMLPLLMKHQLPGEIWFELLKYSPLPNDMVQKIGRAVMAPNPQAQQAQQLDMQERAAEIAETKSKTILNYANALEEGSRGIKEAMGQPLQNAAFAAEEQRKSAAFEAEQQRTEQKAVMDMIVRAAEAAQQQERRVQ